MVVADVQGSLGQRLAAELGPDKARDAGGARSLLPSVHAFCTCCRALSLGVRHRKSYGIWCQRKSGRAAPAPRCLQAVFVHCDVTKEADVERAVVTAVERFGGLDIMCNNAGKGG